MVCMDCKENEAQVHFTQIVNQVKTNLSLCNECAAKRGFHSPLDNIPFPLADILGSMAHNLSLKKVSGSQPKVECPTCGLTFEAFTQQGRFGCGECYNTFRDHLEPIMRKIHGASMHRGKTPLDETTSTEDIKPSSIKEEERLKDALQKAIEDEDFEKAAEIRDKLKTLRESVPTDS